MARELTRKVYRLTKKSGFSQDYVLLKQIRAAAGSSMHNTAEGFDAESNREFMRFLRYSKRSCTELQSQLYIALDEAYIDDSEFKDTYEQAGRTRAAIHGFIKYLNRYERQQKQTPEPLNPEPLNP